MSTACARSAGDTEKVQGIAAALRAAQGPHLFPMPFDVHLDSILKKRQGMQGAGNWIKIELTINKKREKEKETYVDVLGGTQGVRLLSAYQMRRRRFTVR